MVPQRLIAHMCLSYYVWSPQGTDELQRKLWSFAMSWLPSLPTVQRSSRGNWQKLVGSTAQLLAQMSRHVPAEPAVPHKQHRECERTHCFGHGDPWHTESAHVCDLLIAYRRLCWEGHWTFTRKETLGNSTYRDDFFLLCRIDWYWLLIKLEVMKKGSHKSEGHHVVGVDD